MADNIRASLKKASQKLSCPACGKAVYELEKVVASDGRAFHRACLRCAVCKTILHQQYSSHDGKFYCVAHYRQLYEQIHHSGTAVPAQAGIPPAAGASHPAAAAPQASAPPPSEGGGLPVKGEERSSVRSIRERKGAYFSNFAEPAQVAPPASAAQQKGSGRNWNFKAAIAAREAQAAAAAAAPPAGEQAATNVAVAPEPVRAAPPPTSNASVPAAGSPLGPQPAAPSPPPAPVVVARAESASTLPVDTAAATAPAAAADRHPGSRAGPADQSPVAGAAPASSDANPASTQPLAEPLASSSPIPAAPAAAAVPPLGVDEKKLAEAMAELEHERERLQSDRRRLDEEKKAVEAERRSLKIRLLPSGSVIFKRQNVKAEPLAPEVQSELEQLEQKKRDKDSEMEVTNHKLRKLKKRLDKVNTEKTAAQKASEDLKQVLTEERATVSDMVKLTEKLTAEMQQLENERRRLQQELTSVKQEYDTIIVSVVRSAQDAIEGKTKEKKLLGSWKVLELSASVKEKDRGARSAGFISPTRARGTSISRGGEGETIATEARNSSKLPLNVERWGVFQQVDSRLRNAGLLRLCDNYNFEFGTPDMPTFQNVTFEFEEVFVPFYRRYFYDKEHLNYVGLDSAVGPVVITIEKGESRLKTVLWTSEDHERIILPKWKDKIKTLVLLHPELRDIKFTPAVGQRFADSLLEYERRQLMDKYKFGVLYVAAGQSREEEWYSNQNPSADLEQFMEFLGQKVELKDWPHFAGGLQTTGGLLTGQHSYYTLFHDLEIMFHVSCLLPFNPNDPQQLERKRHLGNDIVMFIFRDENCKEPFDPSIIRSQFNHIFIVVQPEKKKGVTRYKIAVASKFGVGPYGPWLPGRGVYKRTPELREFLLTKAVNAECAALISPAFSRKLAASRRDLLTILVQHSLENRPGQPWPTMFNEVKSLKRQTGLRDVRGATSVGIRDRRSGDYGRPMSPLSSSLGRTSSPAKKEDGKEKDRILAVFGKTIPPNEMKPKGTPPRPREMSPFRASPDSRLSDATFLMPSAGLPDQLVLPVTSRARSPPQSPRGGYSSLSLERGTDGAAPAQTWSGKLRNMISPPRSSSRERAVTTEPEQGSPPTSPPTSPREKKKGSRILPMIGTTFDRQQEAKLAAKRSLSPRRPPSPGTLLATPSAPPVTTSSPSEGPSASTSPAPSSFASLQSFSSPLSVSPTPVFPTEPKEAPSAPLLLPISTPSNSDRKSRLQLEDAVLQRLEADLHSRASEQDPTMIALVTTEDGGGTPLTTPMNTDRAGEDFHTCMKRGLGKLEKGRFASALADVDDALKSLVTTPDEARAHADEVKLSVSYKVALRLLLDIKMLEKDPAHKPRVALLTKLLTDLPMFAKHRMICYRMAINKNMDVGNFGVAGRLLSVLLRTDGLPDQANLHARLKKCTEEKFANATLSATYLCPACAAPVGIGSAACAKCDRPASFCFSVLESISFGLCGLCGAAFSLQVVPAGRSCPCCGCQHVEQVYATNSK